MQNSTWKTLKFAAVFILLSLVSTGCVIPIPIDDKVPYTGDFPNPNSELITKSDVIKRFGEPEAIYLHGSIYVYSDFEQTWEVPYLLAAPYSTGEAGVATLGNRYYLILTFDDFGYLVDRKIEIGEGWFDRSESGLCYTAAGHIIWIAGDEEEARIKEFPISSNGCGIYLFLEGTTFPRQTTVSLDGDSLGHVGSIGSGFFYLEVKQGEHLIIANQVNAEPASVRLPLVCKKNEQVFVRLKIRHAIKSVPILELVDNSKGRGKIKWRNLVLHQSSR